MHPSRFAGAIVLAGAALLFGCEQTDKQKAANTNDTIETAPIQGAGSTTQAPGSTVRSEPGPVEVDIVSGSTATPAPEKAAGGFAGQPQIALAPAQPAFAPAPANTENYLPIDSNPVKEVAEAPVSTFSVDVDSGSYANIRRFIMGGQKPPKDAVRVEEMVNYFAYDYAGPEDASIPFKTTTHVTRTPWNANTYLLEIGIKGYQPQHDKRPAANLVFLIDVSGSMDEPDKLPLLKSGMHLLVDQLHDDDKVSIVVYAGAAGVVLEPTSGKDKEKIDAALDRLEAGGSTAGGEGIQLAYAKAKEARIKDGINRIILATDGDFNVGITDLDQLKSMVEDSRKSGIALARWASARATTTTP